MEIVFLSKFNKDLSKINQQKTLADIQKTILQIEQVKSISEISNLKKLKGHKIVYRIKIGDYRIGLFIENNIVEFARILHRKDIYNLFP